MSQAQQRRGNLKDYGNKEYGQDGYFIQHYGSYDLFRAFFLWSYPGIWYLLGGENFIDPDLAKRVLSQDDIQKDGFLAVYEKYTFVVFDHIRRDPDIQLICLSKRL